MKSFTSFQILAVLAGVQVGSCSINERYTNTTTTTTSVLSSTSSSTVSSITAAPTYCGNCTIFYEVHAHIWWSQIFTTIAATLLYTVDQDTGSTIGSSLEKPLNTTQVKYPNFTQYIMNPDGGAIEYTTLNSLGAADLTTIVAENTISMTGPKNIYLYSTSFYNTTLDPPQTVCAGGAFYYAPLPAITASDYNASKTISTYPGVPASTTYTYNTSAYDFGPNYTLAVPLAYGLDSLATAVGSVLGLSSACVIGGGGGVGTLKVGVTALTTSSTIYVAQAVTLPTSPAPTPTLTAISTTPATSSPIAELPSTVSLPPYTPPTIILQPVSTTTPVVSAPETSSPNGPGAVSPLPTSPTPVSISPSSILEPPAPASSIPSSPLPNSPSPSPSPNTSPTQTFIPGEGSSYTTTYLTTISNALGVQTTSVIATLPLSTEPASYTTAYLTTISNSLGVQTTSVIVTLPLPLETVDAFYITTYITTISNSLGVETLSVTATLPLGSVLGSYTTTLLKTTQGLGGGASSTISEVVTLPLASYILSLLGVPGGPGTTTVNARTTSVGLGASATSSGSGSGGSANGSGTATGSAAPEQFTGGVERIGVQRSGLGMVVFAVAVILI